MHIEKVLNNNVVLTTDDNSNELIVMGKGIAFNKKIGDIFDENKIDKVYRLSNQNISQKFQEMLNSVPIEYLELSNEIIDEAKEKLEGKLSDLIYISLTDHIYTAIDRAKQGILIKNILLWDIKRLFPKEYEIGTIAIDEIRKRYQIDLGEDEAGFIALHFVNAQNENGNLNNRNLLELVQNIIQLTKYYFKIDFDEDSVYFYRFRTHLIFFAQRVMGREQHELEIDNELLSLIKKKYRDAYFCVLKIEQFMLSRYRYQMSNGEKTYLTVHIAYLVKNKLEKDKRGDIS